MHKRGNRRRRCIHHIATGTSLKEIGVTDEQFAELYSIIGNLLRISLSIQLEEARAVCYVAKLTTVETMLLDPRQTPQEPSENTLNCQLLDAFEQFRLALEAICRESRLKTTEMHG